MDWFFLVLACILMVVGLIGCFLPILPGPPISFIGVLIIHFTRFAHFSMNYLMAFAFIAIAVTLLDYLVPIWGTKRFGGTKFGQWGATIGLIIGLFLGPLGIIVGPFVGAVIAEAINGANGQMAFKAGIGAFLGFLMGIGLKLIASIAMTYYFIKAILI